MSEVPERIWLLWKDPAVPQRYAASAINHDEEGYKAYIRADLVQPAPDVAALVEALVNLLAAVDAYAETPPQSSAEALASCDVAKAAEEARAALAAWDARK